MTTKVYPHAKTPLERNVARWIDQEAVNYDDRDPASVLGDLFYGGCQSGIVSHLIYYHDTLAFYRKFRREIDGLLAEMVQETGMQPAELLRQWDNDDPLARDTQNQNLLAWLGFEETARRLADRAGIDN